jgi:hypothetical protein
MGLPSALDDILGTFKRTTSDHGAGMSANHTRPQVHGWDVSIGRALHACNEAQCLLEEDPSAGSTAAGRFFMRGHVVSHLLLPCHEDNTVYVDVPTSEGMADAAFELDFEPIPCTSSSALKDSANAGKSSTDIQLEVVCVQRGYMQLAQQLPMGLLLQLLAKDYRLVFTGHGLGGAVAAAASIIVTAVASMSGTLKAP